MLLFFPNNEYCACLSEILLDSIINVDEKYYPRIFFLKCNMQ